MHVIPWTIGRLLGSPVIASTGHVGRASATPAWPTTHARSLEQGVTQCNQLWGWLQPNLLRSMRAMSVTFGLTSD